MLENMKKRIGASSRTPNKVITEISLPQEGDISETISETTIDTDKPIVASNVVSKIVEVAIEEQGMLTQSRLASSWIDSNVSLKWKQRKS
jgi:hypothetical protein